MHRRSADAVRRPVGWLDTEEGIEVRRPAIMRHRDFNLYWSGVALYEIGTRGTFAAILYHVYDRERSWSTRSRCSTRRARS